MLIKNPNAFVYKIMSRAARLLGLGVLYDPKLRALMVLRRAAALCVVSGASRIDLTTVLDKGIDDVLQSDTPLDAQQVAGACAIALVQCAEVQQVGMGQAMLLQLDRN